MTFPRIVFTVMAYTLCSLVAIAADETLVSSGQGATSPITNGAVWQEGRPISFPKARRPPVERAALFEPRERDWKYSHHQSIAAFDGRLYAIWSSAERDEDSPGQRVMYCFTNEAGQWAPPRLLFQPAIDRHGQLRVLTAAGFHQYDGTLVAYAGDYSNDRKSTGLLARTSKDGKNWSEVVDLHVPVCPNHGPQPTSSGRLIIAGNTAFPYTDDPAGLKGWKMAGIYPSAMEPFQDNPTTFWELARKMEWPANLCEGAFLQTDDRVLHKLLRATSLVGPASPKACLKLWETISSDDGVTWSEPRETAFSNFDAKFHFGRLPGGRFYSVGNPLGVDRIPLVLATSRDGVRFDQHFILGDQRYRRRFDGASKGGEYSYPHSLLHDGRLYVIVARQKEGIEVYSVSLADIRTDG